MFHWAFPKDVSDHCLVINQLFINGVVFVNKVIDLVKRFKKTYLILRWILRKCVIQIVGSFWVICLSYLVLMISEGLG